MFSKEKINEANSSANEHQDYVLPDRRQLISITCQTGSEIRYQGRCRTGDPYSQILVGIVADVVDGQQWCPILDLLREQLLISLQRAPSPPLLKGLCSTFDLSRLDFYVAFGAKFYRHGSWLWVLPCLPHYFDKYVVVHIDHELALQLLCLCYTGKLRQIDCDLV